MTTLLPSLFPPSEFERVRASCGDAPVRMALIADMCRANTLVAVKRAGSGHLGTSFSALDLLVWLYHEVLDTLRVGLDSPDRDIYFSSKGHDAPALYAVLHSFGVIATDRLLRLRRLGGLDGHPDILIPGVEANSGSLGMGLSKGRGMAWAKRLLGRKGRVFVLTGDGELQEGQNYEALQAAPNQGISALTMIVDRNEVQSDKPVREIMDLRDLTAKLGAFGWHVAACDGHDFDALRSALAQLDASRSGHPAPAALIARTIKGRGVSFMEHPRALQDGKGSYRWHAGAPDDASFAAALEEILGRLADRCARAGLTPLQGEPVPPPDPVPAAGRGPAPALKQTAEFVADAYGQALVDVGGRRQDLVVLDADLAVDCRTRGFELRFPERYIQNGIAEQDMVSMAGGLARQGLLPVVNSFASFLVSRANEQIFNNATEGGKIVYACHYAGLIPAGPGKSHQSLRDISLLGALPNMTVIQPCNPRETREAVEYSVNVSPESCALRLAIGPSPRRIELPPDYRFALGRGTTLREGRDGLILAYGPVMLHEALRASEILASSGFGLRVVNMPWLNRVDVPWLVELLGPYRDVHVAEDHAPVGGLADFLLRRLHAEGQLDRRRLHRHAVDGFPACGRPDEVLAFHALDGESLAARIGGRPR